MCHKWIGLLEGIPFPLVGAALQQGLGATAKGVKLLLRPGLQKGVVKGGEVVYQTTKIIEKVSDKECCDLVYGFKKVISPFKDGQLTNVGRAITKHPEYFGFENTEALMKAYRSTKELNKLGSSTIKNSLRNGVKTTGTGGRYPNGWVTYSLPNGNAVSWALDGTFIGFRGIK